MLDTHVSCVPGLCGYHIFIISMSVWLCPYNITENIQVYYTSSSRGACRFVTGRVGNRLMKPITFCLEGWNHQNVKFLYTSIGEIRHWCEAGIARNLLVDVSYWKGDLFVFCIQKKDWYITWSAIVPPHEVAMLDDLYSWYLFKQKDYFLLYAIIKIGLRSIIQHWTWVRYM